MRTTETTRTLRLAALCLFTGAVAMLATACGGAQHGDSSGPPAWYPNGDRATFPSDQYMQGVGVCGPETAESRRASCATQRARREVAFNIRTELETSLVTESTFERRFETHDAQSRNQTVEHEAVRDAGAVATALELENTEPRDMHCTPDGHCYSLVVVDRGAIMSRLRREIASDRLTLEGLLSDARNDDMARSLVRLNEASTLASSIDRRIAMLRSLGGTVPVEESAQREVQQVHRDLLGQAEVCFASTEPSAPASLIFDDSVRTMRNMGFAAVRTTDEAGTCQGALLTYVFQGEGETRHSRTTVTDAALLTVEYLGNVHFSVPGMGEQVSSQIRARGVAATAERAHDNALETLAERINEFVRRSLD